MHRRIVQISPYSRESFLPQDTLPSWFRLVRVRDYYDLINNGNYKETWSRLTERFRIIKNLNNYERYVQFWQGIKKVKLNDVSTIAETTSSAKLMLDITYEPFNSPVDHDSSFYVELVWN